MTRLVFLVCVLACACAPSTRPAVFAEVDRVRVSPSVKEASTLAPQAYLYAEKVRREADQAFADDDRQGAQILAEHAIAAYARADVLARLARAEERRADAAGRAERAGRELSTLEETQRRVAAEADGLEMRVRVVRDAQPLVPTEPASAEREAARLSAARSIASQARLLCTAARMLAADTKEVADAFTALDALEPALTAKGKRSPIDEAMRLRSACLSELTRARRPVQSKAPESAKADTLLELLGKASFEPVRDDRGIVVVLRDLFDGQSLKAAAGERVTALAQVAREHPDFPVLVVVHSGRGGSTGRDAARADAVGKALRNAGAPKVEIRAAADTLPVAPSRPAASDKRNERVEIVFVAPSF
jgi:outer membrane protein OmpA-like peptidoglycan-associated protein